MRKRVASRDPCTENLFAQLCQPFSRTSLKVRLQQKEIGALPGRAPIIRERLSGPSSSASAEIFYRFEQFLCLDTASDVLEKD